MTSSPQPDSAAGSIHGLRRHTAGFQDFSGNESELTSRQPLEEVLHHPFGITDYDIVSQEEALDGFYAYDKSLDNEASDVLRIHSYHHEVGQFFITEMLMFG